MLMIASWTVKILPRWTTLYKRSQKGTENVPTTMGMYYLFSGVMMDFTEKGVVTLTMPAFVDEIVRNAEVATIADAPAGKKPIFH